MKLTIKFFIYISFIIPFTGCIDNTLMNVFSGKGDPDTIITSENEERYFTFKVKSKSNNSELNVRVILMNPKNEVLADDYTDNSGNLKYIIKNDSACNEGYYFVCAEIKEQKYGNITEYGKLVFYYNGTKSIKKEILTYPVE